MGFYGKIADGTEFQLRFEHGLIEKEYGETWQVRATSCQIILTQGTPTEVGFGLAVCSPADTFCKAKGRKLALARALKAPDFSREDRRLIWQAYFRGLNKRALTSAELDLD